MGFRHRNRASTGHPASVGRHDGAADVRGLLGCQLGDVGGDLVRLRHPESRCVNGRQSLETPLARRMAGRPDRRSSRRRRADGVAADALVPVRPGDVPGIADEGVLARHATSGAARRPPADETLTIEPAWRAPAAPGRQRHPVVIRGPPSLARHASPAAQRPLRASRPGRPARSKCLLVADRRAPRGRRPARDQPTVET